MIQPLFNKYRYKYIYCNMCGNPTMKVQDWEMIWEDF